MSIKKKRLLTLAGIIAFVALIIALFLFAGKQRCKYKRRFRDYSVYDAWDNPGDGFGERDCYRADPWRG